MAAHVMEKRVEGIKSRWFFALYNLHTWEINKIYGEKIAFFR